MKKLIRALLGIFFLHILYKCY